MGILGSLFPKEPNFFTIFEALAANAIECATRFENYTKDPERNHDRANEIEVLENEADNMVHQGLVKLHDTFITPFDRISIYQLLINMDKVIDLIHAASQRIKLFQIKKLSSHTHDLTWTMVESVKLLKTLVVALEKLKAPEDIQRICIDINKFENKADDEMRKAMADLLENCHDFKEFYKMKDLINLIEEITDTVEDITHLVEAIILDHA
jgi:uncharacterized protein Yka (UPF0111/DUF47 family)